MSITVEKAKAINAWDIKCNGIFIGRFLKKRLAVAECDRLTAMYGGV